MIPNQDRAKSTRGAALFTALAMLAIFTMLGVSFVKLMVLENQATNYDISKLRAEHISDGGIYAAIGELELVDTPKATYTFNLNAYKFKRSSDTEAQRVVFPQSVRVDVAHESGKVNLNHASNELLIAMGIPEESVTLLKQKIAQRPLVNVDDLRSRDIIATNGAYEALNTSDFTVYGDGSLNLNVASPSVLAAVFALSPEEGAALAEKRPFTSWEDVLAKVGKDSWSFTVETRVSEGGQTPAGLSLASNCYRLTSSVSMQLEGVNERAHSSQVEAVVAFDAQGTPAIQYWMEPLVDSNEIKAVLNEEVVPSENDGAVNQ